MFFSIVLVKEETLLLNNLLIVNGKWTNWTTAIGDNRMTVTRRYCITVLRIPDVFTLQLILQQWRDKPDVGSPVGLNNKTICRSWTDKGPHATGLSRYLGRDQPMVTGPHMAFILTSRARWLKLNHCADGYHADMSMVTDDVSQRATHLYA